MRFFLICIFLLGNFTDIISNNSSFSSPADSLYAAENYFEAAIEFERLYFYSNNRMDRNELLFKKALCYKALKKYSKSFESLQRIMMFGLSEEEKIKYTYELSLLAHLSSEYEQCKLYLKSLERFKVDSNLTINILYLGAMNSIMLNEIEQSKQYVINYLNKTKDSLPISKNDVEILYSKKNLPKIKSEKLLFYISFIPGLGQMYAGNIGEGMLNSFLNAAAFTFGVYQIWHAFYFTGYFVGALSINKFYFGGRERAKLLLTVHNRNELIEFQSNLKETLLIAE